MESKVKIKSYKRNWNARANLYKKIKSRIPSIEVLPHKEKKKSRSGKGNSKIAHIILIFL